MSHATIVSLMPIPFAREMIGHNPAYYAIPEAEQGDFNILVAGDGTSWLYVMDGKSVIRKHLAIDEVSELVDTFIEATPYVDENSRPGIFYVEGKWTKDEIREKFAEKLAEAEDAQNSWFTKLVEKADDSWNKYHQHRDISDPQRIAATRLGLKREWNIRVEKGKNFMECPACKTMIRSDVSVCPQCRVIIDTEKEFTFAG